MIKCIAWDLDNTLWKGILDENINVELNTKVLEVIKNAYDRGIMNTVISKNNPDDVYNIIEQKQLEKYFVIVEAGWGAKYISMQKIVRELNISSEHILFVDDSEFELAQMLYYIHDIQVLNVSELDVINRMVLEKEISFNDENRTEIYKLLMKRRDYESKMTRKDFLELCKVELKLFEATEKDCNRITELSNRTNQFNSTGTRYSSEEIAYYLNCDKYDIWIANMKDVFCNYGIIAFCIIEKNEDCNFIRNIAISCRAEGKNVAITFMNRIMEKYENVKVNYIDTGKNGKMRILFCLMGFADSGGGNVWIRENHSLQMPENEEFIDVDKQIEMEIKDIIEDLLKCSLDVDESLELDSIIVVNLLVILEQKYNISIPIEYVDITSFNSIQSISKFVENYLLN